MKVIASFILWATITCLAEFPYRHISYSLPDRQTCLTKIRDMFNFGYSSYLRHAYPADELDPIHCTGRGHDFSDRTNININDVLGNYQLTLVDSLDTLAVCRCDIKLFFQTRFQVLGNVTEFKRAVQLVIDTLSFDVDSIVQIFEANIRQTTVMLMHLLELQEDSSQLISL